MASIPTAPPLPYFCDPSELPARLPTIPEIEASTHSLQTPNFELGYHRVVLVRNKFVVKFGRPPWMTENEGHALLLLRQYPSIPAPRLYAMYYEGDRLFLVMEYKPGVRLDTVWDRLSETNKLAITDQLHAIFADVRAIPSPGIFASVAGGKLRHKYFWSVKPEPDINGPFQNERDFSMAMALRSERVRKSGYPPDKNAWLSQFLKRHFPTALAGHGSVLTHGDVQRKNILVEKVLKDSSKAGEGGEGSKNESVEWRVSAVVDWTEAGWYPSYWEHAAMFIHLQWVNDWPEKYERIVDPCPLEGGMLWILKQDLEF
ncbi:kinase-like protein [Staphylotrichum tortipilum]|uniref:Kinase-like protein n=1 Tax=Staphylotrichum tortipilum TaxID=2831512 RepID=A0AAN6MB47_9PEZI|nr:kinase-like protein [Staphylotrichum longicolle]